MVPVICRGDAVRLALLLIPLAQVNALKPSRYPYKIHLNAAILHAPPMAFVEELESGETSFSGFQIDLLERLQMFAEQDGVDLQLNFAQSPAMYGDAFDLVASDCNTTDNPNPLEDCQKYDIIIGDYYTNADRYMRADLSPAWLRTTISTLKWTDKAEDAKDFTTLTQAEEANATVCVPDGAYLSQVVQAKFPQAQYVHCDQSTECITLLKSGNCVLYANDELLLHHQASHDPSLLVTGESFNTQYLVWPMRENLQRRVSKLFKKWMYRAIQTATLDELYYNYFESASCPMGRAGEQCELPCDPVHGAADADGVCVCKSAKWTGGDCSIEVMEDLNMTPQGLISVGYGFACVNLALVAFCAVWVFRNRKRCHIKMAQPMFLAMILAGCTISTSSIFALAQQDPGDGPVHVCMAIPWLYSVGFSLSFGAMFARVRRIYKVLQCSVQLKRVTISAKETVLTATLVLAIDIVILTVWTILDPLEWNRAITNRDVFGEALSSEGYCTSDHWAIFAGLIALFHILLMAVALYKCYKARKIPERVSNGKYVAIAIFSNFQVLLVLIPVMMMLGSNNPEASFFVRAAAILINDFVVLLLVFGDLMYKVYRHDIQAELAVRMSKRSSHHKIKSDLRRYARLMRGFSSRLGLKGDMEMNRTCGTHTTGTLGTSETRKTPEMPHTSFRGHAHRRQAEPIPCPTEILADTANCLEESTLHEPTFHEELPCNAGLTRAVSVLPFDLVSTHKGSEFQSTMHASQGSLTMEASFHDESTLQSQRNSRVPDAQPPCSDAVGEDTYSNGDPRQPQAPNDSCPKHKVQDLLKMFEGRIENNTATVPSFFQVEPRTNKPPQSSEIDEETQQEGASKPSQRGADLRQGPSHQV